MSVAIALHKIILSKTSVSKSKFGIHWALQEVATISILRHVRLPVDAKRQSDGASFADSLGQPVTDINFVPDFNRSSECLYLLYSVPNFHDGNCEYDYESHGFHETLCVE